MSSDANPNAPHPSPSPRPKRPSLFRRLSHLGFRQNSMDSTDNAILEGLERYNRLTTELANERTLLAWMRTCFAAMRTVFSFQRVSSDSVGLKVTLSISEVLMTTLMISAALLGSWRFFKIKNIIALKEPPAAFGRFSLRPMSVIVILASLSAGVAMYADAVTGKGFNQLI